MKKVCILFVLLWFHQKLFAQTIGNVGINTHYPDPSAVLDVQAGNKGVLLPRVFLQSTTDGNTIPNPSKGLLIFNTNSGLLDKVGFYYNAGNAVIPLWRNLEENLKLPFSQTRSDPSATISISNTSSSGNSAGIGGYSDFGQAVAGISSTGRAVSGTSSQAGTGIYASSTGGIALEVDGKINYSGSGISPGTGKVLTSDGLGNASWMTPLNEFETGFTGFQSSGVLGGGSQNMSESTFVKIAFASQQYDIGNNYNDATMAPHSSFIAPKNGIYHFDVMVNWQKADVESSFGPTMKLVRIRGGITTELSESRAWSTNGYHTSRIAIDCELQQGDLINVIARAYGQQVALLTFEKDAHFNGHLAIEL